MELNKIILKFSFILSIILVGCGHNYTITGREWHQYSQLRIIDDNNELHDSYNYYILHDYGIFRSYDTYALISIYDEKVRIIVDFNKYDSIDDHVIDGLIRVKLNDRYGFIDTLGNEIIPPFYDSPTSFEHDLAIVNFNNKYGVINKENKIIIKIKYDLILDNYDSLFTVVINDKQGVIDVNDKILIPPTLCKIVSKPSAHHKGPFDFIRYNYNINTKISYGKLDFYSYDKIDFFDKTGKIILSIDYDSYDGFSSDGIALVGRKNSKDEIKYGYIDTLGKEITAFKYDAGESFINGRAIVALGEYEPYTNKKDKRKFKWGVIDKFGNEITPIKYSEIRHFKESRAVVGIKGIKENYYDPTYYGAIDENGKEITPLKYVSMEDFDNGKAKVLLRVFPNECGYVDLNGKEYLTDFD